MAGAMPVYCPSCEAGVEATAKFCLQCGHDLETDGPITSTGHDVRQLKELIRGRDDLSMAEKFDLIANVEEGQNPIELGLAAPAEGIGELFVSFCFSACSFFIISLTWVS